MRNISTLRDLPICEWSSEGGAMRKWSSTPEYGDEPTAKVAKELLNVEHDNLATA
jgi:hypothetical protein